MRFERADYPELPGVYLMKDAQGQVIYVGKALSLRARLSQYFGKLEGGKTKLLVSRIDSIEFVVTKTEKEALILESNLIKSYMPRFNMTLKDARHFSYLALTKEKFPRLLVARKNSEGRFRVKDAEYFGPFVEGAKRAISARYLRKLFRMRICTKMPKKECLQYHIGNCGAPCIGNVSAEEYSKNVDSLRMVLEGKGEAKRVIASLESRMKEASESQDYERAAGLRDQVSALKIFFDRQRVESERRNDEDFLFFQRIGDILHVQALRSRHGVISKAERHTVAIKEQEEPEISFCIQFYTDLPDRVYSNLPRESMAVINDALGTDAFRVPGEGKRKILEIASRSLAYGEIETSVLRLKEALGLESNPIVIETFDISTLFGEESVASMVQFVNGKPNKAGYRRFKIKTVTGQDDFAMMKEVVYRRYSRLLDEGGSFPDLVLIDGGAGQLHAALDALELAGVRLPVAALAKKEEELYTPGRMHPLRLPRSDEGLKLCQRCRDEAHRFAVTFQRLRRGKKMGE